MCLLELLVSMIMNIMGRQLSKSSTMVHHHRQHADNFVDVSVHNKWLHSSNLLHNYGVGSRSSRNLLSSSSATPPLHSRSNSLRSRGDCDEFPLVRSNSGLLDLHSFDTELLPQTISGQPQSNISDYPAPDFSSKLSKRYQDLPENCVASPNLETSNVAKIKVVVRKRPLNKKERRRKEEDIITVEPNSCSLTVNETKLKIDLTKYVEKHQFVFDAVLDESVSNEEVYSETVEPIIPLIFHRTKATCFAYGQTGSGKTYTMQPLPLRASRDMLWLMLQKYRHQGFKLYVSFFEIYGGKLFDLLNGRRKLCTREDAKQQVCIVGLQEYEVSDVETIRLLIEKGNATRSMGTTGANEESSRSHAILQLAIKKSTDGSKLKPAKPVGKLSFIDLAGSERGADTYDNDKQTRLEGAEINKSLLALKECIRALDHDQVHIPFRGSKLTEVLRDSFIGDSRTVMISCISPSSGSCEHTLNTLRYADRVKSLTKGSGLRTDLAAKEMLNEKDVPCESDRLGREASPSSMMIDYSPRGRTNSDFPTTSPSNHQTSFDDIRSDTRVYSSVSIKEKSMVIEKDARTIKREIHEISASDILSEDDLNFLLKEEDDLIKAHQRQVEETLDIVREEMNLLSEADKPGNNLNDYIFKLNAILTQKAAGILALQTRLAQFHRHLNEQNILAPSNL